MGKRPDVARKAENIYSLTLYRKSLPTPVLDYKIFTKV